MKLFRRPQHSGEVPAPRPRRRRSHLILGALGIGLLGFLLGCYLFFPASALRDRLTAEVAARSRYQLQLAGLGLHFPFGLNAQGVKLSGGGLPVPVSVEQLQLTPLWLSLVGADPGVQLRAELYGGNLHADIHRSGSFAARSEKLALAAPLGQLKSLAFSATLREATASGAVPLRTGTATNLRLVLDNLQLTGLKALGSGQDLLRLGTVTLEASSQGNNFRIESLTGSGADLALTGSGSLLLGNSAPQSRLNLALNLKPAANLDPALRDLLGMFAKPTRDGSLRVQLTGSLDAPNLQ